MSEVTAGQLDVTHRSEKFELPAKGKVNTYFLTSAQNNTNVNLQVWNNLLAIAKEKDARIMAASFTYNKAMQSATGGAKRKTSKETDTDRREWWAPEVEPYLEDRSIELAPGLIWCGEIQILPTAVRPLSGLESYTGRNSGIFPHTKFAVESIPSPKRAGTKFNYTTGTVTQRNYIQKKAGQKAEFHHGYGALLVEVDHEGTWFVRQLNADGDGVMYDLGMKVDAGKVTYGHRPEAIVWGDIHVCSLEHWMQSLCWGRRGILQRLKPKIQVMHDVFDFRAQSYHDRDDNWKVYKKHLAGKTSIAGEIREVRQFLRLAAYKDVHTYVVFSNHDEMFTRWLKDADFRADPQNAELFLSANLAAYESLEYGSGVFNPLEWAVYRGKPKGFMPRTTFLEMDEQFIVCPDAGGGIELGMHGHKGANGARGSQHTFARTGRKSITGHTHTAWQHGGAMGVGITGSMDQGYNEGMSSWSQTFALVYSNGKRTLSTIYDQKWRAQ